MSAHSFSPVLRLPRGCDVWLPDYLRGRVGRWRPRAGAEPCRRVWLTIADHFEPLGGGSSDQVARERVASWRRRWPEIAARFHDAAGRSPVYTFFYPEEEYRPFLLAPLAELTAAGIADVEVHLHHDGESATQFLDRMSRFIQTLTVCHGLLRNESGRTRFGFIHGNWALANSLPNGRWCGVDHEIALLRQLGCYADFTMPSAVRDSQARMVNRLYWATDDGDGVKAHDCGIPLEPGRPAGDLLIVPGPIGFRWRERIIPRIETGEIAVYDMPTRYRAQRWLDLAPRVGADVFVKLFAHGAQDRHRGPLLNGGLSTLLEEMTEECGNRGLALYFASAWQMYRAAIGAWMQRDPVVSAFSSDVMPVEGLA